MTENWDSKFRPFVDTVESQLKQDIYAQIYTIKKTTNEYYLLLIYCHSQ